MKKEQENLIDDTDIAIEIAFASAVKQIILQLQVPANTTARRAVEMSGIQEHFPEFDFQSGPIGVFGKTVPDDYVLSASDRVEIYRPLLQTPTQMRRRRAKIQQQRNRKKAKA